MKEKGLYVDSSMHKENSIAIKVRVTTSSSHRY